ncbi:SR-related and CTD-associated factor 4-like isoform 2-T2 [Menidia menidia]
MDAVNAFNMELFSMIDMKPPISRAKMMSVTKSAIKAIKLYKHVVQIVEKFIKKCKPELKVPGLYVVDSIVRQSRHQFGVEKDVFGPRFLKNFTDTFQNLYRCPDDDKTKIVRVLNLWQKNGVFDLDIIQPLMSMADGVGALPPTLEVPVDLQPKTQPPVSNASVGSALPKLPSPDALAAVAQLFQSPHGQELQRMLKNFQQADKTLAASNSLNPPQRPGAQPNAYCEQTEKKNSLAEKLLDRFDYDDEPDEPVSEANVQSRGISNDVLHQFPGQRLNTDYHPDMMGQPGDIKQSGRSSHGEHHLIPDGYRSTHETYSHSQRGNSRENSSMRQEGRLRGYGRGSRSGSRSPRRRRSRSSSRSRRPRHQRSHSRERRWRSRSNSQDRSEREKDRERRQRGLPSIKSQTLSVCSTTLWVGQLDKKTQQSDVMSLLEEFGQIESINMIPPRGCAYIVMVHRQDANTALNKLSRGSYKVNQKPVKIAWALNKGIKSAHKKFWDVERGVTYIPWNKVKVEELDSFREGGMLDAESLNPDWNYGKDLNNKAALNGALEMVPDRTVAALIQVPTLQQSDPIGSPHAYPSPIILSPTSMAPAGPHFMPAEFDPANLAAGGLHSLEDPLENSSGNKDPSSDGGRCSQLGSPPLPVMTLPNHAVLQGPPRPGMSLQHPPGLPGPHMPPFMSPPNMQHLPPQMLPGGFPSSRFRMPMPFPPRGPPFQRYPAARPEGITDREGRPFGNGRPGFGCPPFQRGRW